MNSPVLDGLSCNLREAYEFARSVTQDENGLPGTKPLILDSDRRIVRHLRTDDTEQCACQKREYVPSV